MEAMRDAQNRSSDAMADAPRRSSNSDDHGSRWSASKLLSIRRSAAVPLAEATTLPWKRRMSARQEIESMGMAVGSRRERERGICRRGGDLSRDEDGDAVEKWMAVDFCVR